MIDKSKMLLMLLGEVRLCGHFGRNDQYAGSAQGM